MRTAILYKYYHFFVCLELSFTFSVTKLRSSCYSTCFSKILFFLTYCVMLSISIILERLIMIALCGFCILCCFFSHVLFSSQLAFSLITELCYIFTNNFFYYSEATFTSNSLPINSSQVIYFHFFLKICFNKVHSNISIVETVRFFSFEPVSKGLPRTVNDNYFSSQ